MSRTAGAWCWPPTSGGANIVCACVWQPQRRGSFRRGQSGVKLLGGVTSLGDLQVGAHIDDFFDKSADSEAQFNVVSLDMLVVSDMFLRAR